MIPPAQRFVLGVVREALFLAIAALGSWVFLNHQILYLDRDFQPSARPFEAYLATAFVLYMFIRAITYVAQTRVPTVRGGEEVCPECGQVLDDGPIEGIRVHHGVAQSRAPPHGAATGAIAFQRGFERGPTLDLPGRVENPSGRLLQSRNLQPFPVVRPVRRTARLESAAAPLRPGA